MFWRMTALSASSPVESVLDKEDFTLEELLDEEEVIQECKALNSRLINFLRERAQVEQLLRYIVEEAPEDAESKRAFKFPFIACEVFTCEIDVILKTLVEDEELMDLLFSFLEPNHPHSSLLAGYFSKVVVCLMLRKTVSLMNYVQAHQDVFRQLVDLIGITSIMEVLIRLVGADDHVYPNFMDVMEWLANSNLLEMIVDKLNPSSSPEVHANTAETLCAITRNAPSALSVKLSSPSFVERIFGHALEDRQSKSGLVDSLSVCISLLDSKRATYSPLVHSIRSQHLYEPQIPINPETVSAMLPKLGDLLKLLNVCSDSKVLPTTYGELKPPLGKHRLKIVEFIAVLLRSGNEIAEKELVSSGAIRRILELFFEYPFHNALHHQVESIILSCLESKDNTVVDHLLKDCDVVGKILQADQSPILSGGSDQPTSCSAGKQVPRAGNLGHITRISNKLIQLGNGNSHIQAYLQENDEWISWQTSILQERNNVENVNRWACGRPSALQDRMRDSDEEDDVAGLANNLSQAFSRYSIYENDDAEQDVYFDDESAEVVISSLRLGDDQQSLFTNSNWFAFQDDGIHSDLLSTSEEKLDEVNLNGANGGSSSSDDEVVVGEDEELVNSTATSTDEPSGSSTSFSHEASKSTATNGVDNFYPKAWDEKASTPGGAMGFVNGDDPFSVSQPDWVGWRESTDLQADQSDENEKSSLPNGNILSNGSSSPSVSSNGQLGTCPNEVISEPTVSEKDVEFVGMELEGSERAMDQALKEGIVDEAGPLKKHLTPNAGRENEKMDKDGEEKLEFNDTNYWRVDQEVGVQE
ncbi:serine/threonine-protein phosphatase 6 regulatory subunit 3-like isoform X2 [Papaver somniferum]|uniref:serine/threonine-protein phosphatase 6 regulatory subunit 3-like isoform X2 n=1 Tax=Papaver somniferum TaxID=3469 RepID=UPI000E6FFBC1|nr:serine/threonine-protein phosphatase 6 regulatory subunit 3-like isoform X2 [Papaver somniferum]